MGFYVESSLPPAPPYGLPPNVIRASYAFNLIVTDAFQFATSRRKVCNLFTISPLPGAGSETLVAEFIFYPLPTANGTMEIMFFGQDVRVRVASLTDGVDVSITGFAAGAYTGFLTGLSNDPQLLQIFVEDQDHGYLAALFICEASLDAGQLP